jgi:homoserine O-acetyltransferase
MYQIEAVLDQVAKARAQSSDANHFLYLAKANQLFVTGHGESIVEGLQQIEARTLLVHTDEDLIFFPEEVQKTAALISSDGTPVEIAELEGTRGHLIGVLGIGQIKDQLKNFLEN